LRTTLSIKEVKIIFSLHGAPSAPEHFSETPIT